MSDFTRKPCHTVITGITGTGKTTLAFLHLLKTPAACRFIFDDQGQASARLKIPLASTPGELERSLKTRWSAFNPHTMFPGDLDAALVFWSDWVFKKSKLTPHKKLAFVDEFWRLQTRDKIAREVAMLPGMGRVENLEFVTSTLEPHRLNSVVTGNCTELICFRQQDSVDLKKLHSLGAESHLVENLPLGSFISYNRITRKSWAGKLF